MPKVSFRYPGNVHAPDALAAWGGRGAVLLHARDDPRFARLLERIRASTLAAVEDTGRVAAVAGRVCHRLAVPAPPGLPRPAGQSAPDPLPHTGRSRSPASAAWRRPAR
ncbi:hypothetical protein GCM10010495_33050 [Kitasatospora herbaricolor]|nr:hypothetical protein [Kitasatospora herbaricolor]GGV16199.1 hypothetical protein GCM10010495_33050 [Kitasatospora herbaricolor]